MTGEMLEGGVPGSNQEKAGGIAEEVIDIF